MRKGVIALSVIFTLALIAAGYYLQKSKKIEIIDPFLMVPADAAIIVETPDFPELLTMINEKNGMMQRLSAMDWASHLLKYAYEIDSITGKSELREFITGQKTIISFHPGANGRLNPIVAMGIGPVVGQRRINSMITLSGAKIAEVKERNGIKVFVARYGNAGRTNQVYFASTAGVLIATTSESLLAKSLDNKTSGSDIRLQQGFSKVSGAFGSEKDNLFVLFRNLPPFLNGLIKTPLINEFSGVAVAAGGEIDAKEGGLFVSGFMATSGSGSGADKIMDISPGTPGVQEILPFSTVSFQTVMRESVLSGTPTTDPSETTATDMALSLRPFTENEMTMATINAVSGKKDVILFRVNNPTEAEEALKSAISGKYKSMGIKSDKYIEAEGRNEEKILIYKMPFTGIASMLGLGQKLTFEDNYAVFCRSYLVFADEPQVLIDIVNASLTETTLINDRAYREVEKSLPTKSSFLYYGTAEAMTDIVLNILTPEKYAAFKTESFSSLGAIGLSLTPSNNMIYMSLSVAYKDQAAEEYHETVTPDSTGNNYGDTAASYSSQTIQPLWKTSIGSAPVIKPFVFTNHNSDAKEIFIQDASNNIYLLSASGKILWKAPIRERVRGDVYMIDYYNNGKYQILFAGNNYLHLIDRNGNYVDRYPVRLKSPASNTLSVFDYENNKDYRCFIAGEDKKINAYDKSGSIVKGWAPFVTGQKTGRPVKHFRTGGKDYLIAYDAGNLYILDRRGNKRVNLQQPVNVAEKSSVRLTKGGKIVFADQSGAINFLDFTGSTETKKPGDYSPGLFFDYAELNRDGRSEYVIIDKGMLTTFRDDFSTIATVKLPTERYLVPQVLNFSSGPGMIALTDDIKGLVWLFDEKGGIASGFPVKGSVMPVAVRLSATTGNTIITGGPDNNVYCYKVSK